MRTQSMTGIFVCMSLLAAFQAYAEEGATKSFVYKKTKQADLEIVVHYPPGWKDTDKRPGVVFFFGGGWTSGKITQFEPQATHLASRGMVAARADYRVKSRHGVTPKECVEDAKSAVRWLRQNAAKVGIDPNRIVASGGSAGGHIAACTALVPGLDVEGEDLRVSSIPNAIVLFNPVLRLDLPQLLGYVGHDESLAKAISPTLHLKKDSPPTILFFGTADQLKAQGDEFMKKSKELGHQAELFTAEGQPHGFFNRLPWQERTTLRMDEFLVSIGYLQAKPEAEKATKTEWVSTFTVDKTKLVSKGKNPYFILEPGYCLRYKGDKATLTVTILNETKLVDGVETRIVEERETKNGQLAEVSRNYFAIDNSTNAVYYFGEDVDMYKDGKVVNHEGSWLSGVNEATFGLMMPGKPKVGDKFQQEVAPKVAMDRCEIVAMGDEVTTPAGTFKNCLRVKESSGLESGTTVKVYAPGVGLVKDDEFVLVKP